MRDNSRITALFDKLHAAGVSQRCFWQTRRDGKKGRPDVEFLSFRGDGFAPSVSTAIIISYKDDGYGLYVESRSSTIDADVAMIAAPRDPGLATNKVLAVPQFLLEEPVLARLLASAKDCFGTAPARDVVLRPFIADAERELEDRGYTAAQAESPNADPASHEARSPSLETIELVDLLDEASSFIDGFVGDDTQDDPVDGLADRIGKAVERYRTGTIAPDPRTAFIEMVARLSASGDKVDLDGEEWPNGYVHDTGGSLDALDELIHKARALTDIQPPEPQAADGGEEEKQCDDWPACA